MLEFSVSDNKETVVPFKKTPAKRTSSKKENMNLNCLSSNKNKYQFPETVSWASLPANLLKPGKVPYLVSSTFSVAISYFRISYIVNLLDKALLNFYHGLFLPSDQRGDLVCILDRVDGLLIKLELIYGEKNTLNRKISQIRVKFTITK